MKLNYLHIVGFQGLHILSIEEPLPVVLVTGPNACGKSSVRDAVQFALDGSSGRCGKIKDYATHLLNDKTERKNALVTLQLDAIEYQRKVATGEFMTENQPDFPAIMPWLIGTEKLSRSDHKTMQHVITAASGVKVSGTIIRDRLLDLGVDKACVEHIGPFLRAGFAAGLKETKLRLTGVRGEWKGITGETFGVEKADGWRPRSVDTVVLIEEIEAQVVLLKKLRGEQVTKRDSFQPVEEGKIPSRDFVDIGPCPGCGVELRKSGRVLYVKDNATEEAPPDTSRAVESYASLDRLVATTDMAIGREFGRIKQVKAEAAMVDERVDKAARAFNEFNHWNKLKGLLSPNGLPKAIIEEALKPINKRMVESSVHTQWPITVISPELSIVYDGRLYGMCSDSERWRANATLAEALAYVSGVKFFALDRMDLLAPRDRGRFIKWISEIKDEHDTIMIMATLKNPPPAPYGFTSIWLGPQVGASHG